MNELLSELLESARALDLPRDSEGFREAVRTVTIALEEGFTAPIALDLARSVLIRASQNSSAA